MRNALVVGTATSTVKHASMEGSKLLVVQINTAGMERVRDDLRSALEKVLRPTAILLRNDTASREQEGLEKGKEVALGEVPEWVEIEENGVRFEPIVVKADIDVVGRQAREDGRGQRFHLPASYVFLIARPASDAGMDQCQPETL